MKENKRIQTHRRWRPLLLLPFVLLLVTILLSPAAAAASAHPTVPLTQDGSARLSNQVYLIDGVTYVPFRAFCEMQGGYHITWDAQERVASAQTPAGVTIYAAADGALYIQYGDRYFYTATPVRIVNDRVYIPIRPLAKCFGLTVTWSAASRSVALTSTGVMPRSDASVYSSDELYWLSRIIQAEAGGESLKGKLAVGNVILNRVRSAEFPNTIYGVIFDRKFGVQFTPTVDGTINNTPSVEALIAAKMCLEGYSLSDEILYFFNPSIASSFWISQHRPYAFRIGNHVFYK